MRERRVTARNKMQLPRHYGLCMALTRDEELRASHALTEQEIAELADRCPEPQRKLFEGWLRGERQLDGDPIDTGDSGAGEEDNGEGS